MRLRRFASTTPLVLLALAACASPGTPLPDDANSVRVAVGSEVRLPYHRQLTVEDTPYVIRFDDVVEDSRCAPDVQCVWAGRVRIGLSFAGGATTAGDTLAFPANAAAGDGTARYGDIVVRFVGYEPAPAPSGQVRDPEKAIAVLAIERPSQL